MSRKKAAYFKHFNDMKDEERVVQLRMEMGPEGYGIFILLLELLNATPEYKLKKDYSKIAYKIQLKDMEDKIQQVVEDYDLFTVEGEWFHSIDMTEWMEEYEEKCRQNSQNRKIGHDRKRTLEANPVKENSYGRSTVVEDSIYNRIPIEEEKNKKENKIEDDKENAHNSIFRKLINEDWITLLANNYKSDINTVKNHLNKFRQELILKGKFKESEEDAKSHFVSWVNRANHFPGTREKIVLSRKTENRNPL